MKARIFLLGGNAAEQDQNFDEILRRTFADVLTDNDAIAHFTSLKDATVAIGKAFSDSDTVMFFADIARMAETKDILCKALGLKLTVNEELLSVALKTASAAEQEAAYFNVCHAGIAEGSQPFALKDALFAGFGCKRGRQVVVLLPYSGERTRVLLATQVIPYLNAERQVEISTVPLQFYYAEQLNIAARRENIRIALAGTKSAEVFMKYIAYAPELAGKILHASKAENRGTTAPNEYVVNLSITAAEFMGVPYGVAMSNAYYVGDDPNAPKTVYIAVTNDTETTVRELHSFYGESTGDFLFRCCGELCRLLARIIDADAGLTGNEKIDKKAEDKKKKKAKRYKRAIAVILALILLIGGGGYYYFYTNSYTLQDWANKYVTMARQYINSLTGATEPESTTEADTAASPTDDGGIGFYTLSSGEG